MSVQKVWKSLVMAPLMLVLASCSEDVKVNVERKGTVTLIRFGLSEFFSSDLKPICLRLVEVRTYTSDDQLWKIVKKGNECVLITSVDLGRPLPGFFEQVNRLPLRANQEYVVSIVADEGAATSKPWRE